MSTTTPSSATSHCPTCNAALAHDQRYCLNCGQRLTAPRVDFERSLGLQPAPVAAPVKTNRWERIGPLQTLMALGAVLLALGVGIVIGRGNGSSASQKPQVVTVQGAAPTSGTAGSPAQPVGSVSEDWPSGTSAYTVELGTLDKSGATTATVTSAKSQASGKGAPAVGVLDGDAHGGTPTGKYILYSGTYASKKQADAAAAKLKKNFPAAIVLHVTPQGSGSGGSTGNTGSGKSSGGAGTSSGTSQAQSLKGKSGNAYVKASAKLPTTVGTGNGPAPKKDKKKAGGGTSATCIGC